MEPSTRETLMFNAYMLIGVLCVIFMGFAIVDKVEIEHKGWAAHCQEQHYVEDN